MHLYIAIPAIDELEQLPETLTDLSQQQTKYNYTVYVCVNQPESWWTNPEKVSICHHNQQLIKLLKTYSSLPIQVIDRSSPGMGWKDKREGVGWARRTLFEQILKIANSQDIIISLDADTRISANYLQSIGERFEKQSLSVISLPYYHRLTNDIEANRAILRYELYMRNFLLNMYAIHSPYNFTAIGSAIAVRAESLRKIGNITPMKSGEDFYLLQKLRKMTPISNYNQELVYPAARFSSRVYFGTGPAMIKGKQGHWESYPIYHHTLFTSIAESYQLIPKLYTQDITTPFLDFLKAQYKDEHLWDPLRKNAKNIERFERAFHEKADGLRILQFLKEKNNSLGIEDAQALRDNMKRLIGPNLPEYLTGDYKLEQLTVPQLANLREIFFQKEMELRNEITQ